MVESTYFDKLEAVARAVRKKDSPFGGIQLILSGDFLQLPPVTKQPGPKKFCFQVNMVGFIDISPLAKPHLKPHANHLHIPVSGLSHRQM